MHEAALLADLVRRATEIVAEHGGSRAAALVVSRGPCAHASAAQVRSHLEILSTGTVLEGAAIDVETRGGGEELRLVSVTVDGH